LAQGAAAEGVDVVVSLGGDGTVNEVANGLAGTDTALGVLPGGSTNVFARTLGLPNDPVEAVTDLLDALARRAIRPVGLGSVNKRYFCFHTGVGFDAAVVDRVEHRSHLKRWAGHPLFVAATLAELFGPSRRRRVRFRLELGDGTAVERSVFTVVMNTNPYTFLGNTPLSLAPEAGFDRALSVVSFRSLRAWTLGRAFLAALRGKPLPRSRALRHASDVPHLVVTSERPFPYQVDGDFLGAVTRLEFRHVPDALNLVVPGD
jgi:diacylglycerol kinase family enzyme